MTRYDSRINIDGEHTVWTENGRVEIRPASTVYTWRRGESAYAWPLHEERGQTSRDRFIREHEQPPMLDANLVGNMHWNPFMYETAVYHQLDRVFRTRIGACLHRELSMEVTIMPFPIRDPVFRDVYRPNAAPRARGSDRSLYIIYTPGHFLSQFCASSLFHELVHVYRIMLGIYRPRAEARDPYRYTNWEEFPAVCIENVFRSEAGIPLRWGHLDITQVLRNPETWINNTYNRRALERLIREMPAFTRSISEIEIPFNPFRLIYRERS